MEGAEVGLTGVVLAVFTFDFRPCVAGPGSVRLFFTSCGLTVDLSSSFVSFCSTLSSILSFFLSNSNFSGRSSWRTLGRGSLVLPLTMRFVRPREMSSLSSVLTTSCLKENPGIDGVLDTAAGMETNLSSSSVGRTFLTTRRTTFTTFLRVSP